MKIIHKQIRLIEDVVGKQKFSDEGNSRLLTYVNILQVDGGFLVYNVLTRCMVLLDVEEYENIYKIAELQDLWFVVPFDFNDKIFCNQLKELYKLFDKKEKYIDSYTIFTTTDCNAHCFYCFERGVKRVNMPHKVAVDTANYIITHSHKCKVTIWWFGGEPLYNLDAIDTICTLLHESNVEFVSKIVSNGFLFNKDLINRAKTSWNLAMAQITLDGCEEIYNRTKSYIYKNVNPFNVVLQNIGDLIEYNINLRVRFNVSSKNQDDLFKLLDVLHLKFGNNKNLIVYPHLLYKNTEYSDDSTIEYKRKSYISCSQLKEKISYYGFSPILKINEKLKIYNCMADSDTSCFISPLGKIGCCRDNCDSSFYGSIYNEDFDSNVIDKYKKQFPHTIECDNCCSYPDCINLLMCPDNDTCDEFKRAEKNELIKQQMLNTYNSYLKKQQITKDENDEIEIQC